MESKERVQGWMEEMTLKHGWQGDMYWREAWDSFYQCDFYDRPRIEAKWQLNKLRLGYK